MIRDGRPTRPRRDLRRVRRRAVDPRRLRRRSSASLGGRGARRRRRLRRLRPRARTSTATTSSPPPACRRRASRPRRARGRRRHRAARSPRRSTMSACSPSRCSWSREADGAERLVVNEIAPRVHNSGHWTIEGATTSQFEQHVRAVCGWPLGDPTRAGGRRSRCTTSSATRSTAGRRSLAEPGAHLHLYGKGEARPGRKMGHVTRLKPLTSDASGATAGGSRRPGSDVRDDLSAGEPYVRHIGPHQRDRRPRLIGRSPRWANVPGPRNRIGPAARRPRRLGCVDQRFGRAEAWRGAEGSGAMTSDSVRIQRACSASRRSRAWLAGCETWAAPPARAHSPCSKADTTGATQRQHRLAVRGDPAQPERRRRLQHPRRGLCPRRASYRDAIGDFTKAVQLDPNSAPGLQQPRPGLSPDRPQRRRARRISPRRSGRSELRRRLYRPRQPAARPGRPRRRHRRSDQAIRLTPESAEAFHARGLSGRSRARTPPGHRRLRRRHRPQPLRRRALRRARPEPHRHEPVRQGDRGLQRGPQRQQQGRQFLGLSRPRLREVEPEEGGEESYQRAAPRPDNPLARRPRPRAGRNRLAVQLELPPHRSCDRRRARARRFLLQGRDGAHRMLYARARKNHLC